MKKLQKVFKHVKLVGGGRNSINKPFKYISEENVCLLFVVLATFESEYQFWLI